MGISIGINYWDDPKGLYEILESVNRLVDRVYIIDGKYEGRLDMPEYDPKYTEAIINKYDFVKYVKLEGVKQIEKRNTYWELAERDDPDWMVVLDSDENIRIEPDALEQLSKIRDEAHCYPILSKQVGVADIPVPRLFRSPYDFRHRESGRKNCISHGSLFEEHGYGREIIQDIYKFFDKYGKNTGVPGLRMIHDKKWRSDERVRNDYLYYDENPMR